MVQGAYRAEEKGKGQQKKLISAHEAYSLLVGEIGIPRHEFLYELRLWELDAIVTGYRRRAIELWNSTRWQTFYILSAMGAKLTNPKDIQEFPWDHDDEAELTVDEVNDIKAEIDAINSMHNEENNGDNSSLL